MLAILLYTRGNPFIYAVWIIALLACGLVFWFTRGIAFGYLNSKLSESAKTNVVALHVITSFILALALPNNYLKSFPFFESLYDQSEIWIPISMFFLLVLFVTFFGFILSILFKPLTDGVPNPTNSDPTKEHYGPNRFRFSTLIFVSTGAFILWLLSGFRGTFNDRMSRYYDADNQFDRNYLIGFSIFFILVTSLISIIS